MNEAPELKTCPFCGFDAAKIMTIRDGRVVTCHNCHASGPAYYHGLQGIGATPALAADKWNRRANLSSPLEAVAMRDAALKAIMDIWAELWPKMAELELQHPAQPEIDAICAIPLPDHAAMLAAALKLPEVAAMVDAAMGVIARWDSPDWKSSEYEMIGMAKLRTALAPFTGAKP
jgi:hypothetical protein